ncbi:MAG: Ig-like domain-containing protein [Pirellulaceae bacterium]
MRKGFESLEARQLLAADLLFADSFEGGGSSNNWAGNWVEDSQNDWFRSSQRASDGGISAEVDGYAANATLSLASPVDLSGYQSSQLSFDWYIEGGFDRNEFLALDISTNNGASWQTDVRRLDGNVDAENTWHSDTVDLTPFHSSQLLVRFRSVVSSSSEDANVDNVQLVGVPQPTEPSVFISDATTVEGDQSLQALGTFVSEGSGGLARPRLSTFGPDRNADGERDFYIASGDTDEILVYNGIDGAFLGQFVTGVSQLDSPIDLQFSLNNEYLYVSSNTGNAVHRFDGASGAYIDTPVIGLANPQGISLDANGDLLIANRDTDEVLRYDGQSLSVLIPAGSGGLDTPREALVGPDGKLYVSSSETSQVLRYDLSSGASEVFAAPALGSLSWIAFSPDGSKLYATGRDTSVCCDTSLVTIDAATGEVTDTLQFNSGGWSFSVGPDATIYNSGNGFGNYVNLIGPSPRTEFNVSLSQPWSFPVTVDFATSDITAIAGSDYVATSGTLVFEPGVTSLTIAVPTLDDTIPEASETFAVTLLSAVGATLADAQGVGTIADNDLSQPPQAAGDGYVVAEDMLLSVTAPGVLGNDSDPEGDPLTAALLAAPAHGTLSLSVDGSFVYVPNADYHGPDSFTYRADDGRSPSNVATVSIEVTPVNDAPQPQGDQYAATQDTALSIAPASGVLANDFDVDGDSLTAVPWSGSSAQGGQVLLNGDGSFSYTPPIGFTGLDSFQYSANDGLQRSLPVTVTIDVTEANKNSIYVANISVVSQRIWWWTRQTVTFEIRKDSNGDGQGGGEDEPAAGVTISYEFNGATYSGVTGADGRFQAQFWAGSGFAEVTDLAFVDFEWDRLLDLVGDSDGDGFPDASS